MKSVCCKETTDMKSRKSCGNGLTQYLTSVGKLGNRRSSEGFRTFSPSHGTNLAVLLVLEGDIEMNPGPRFQCRLCKKYCKTSDKVVECEDCIKRFHATYSELGNEAFEKLKRKLILGIAQTAKRIADCTAAQS